MSPLAIGTVSLLLLAACGAPSPPSPTTAARAGDAAPPAGVGAPALASPAPRDAARTDVAPLRVLMLSGGAYHDFGPNLERLVDGLQLPHGVHWTFLPLGDADEDGVPVALRLRRFETLDLPAAVDVVLAYTQGELGLSDDAKEKLLGFVRAGGGFVGLHSAADSHPGWDEYTRMLGGRFASHPPYGPLRVRVDGPSHAVTAGLPFEWSLEDEFYHLRDLHLDDATVLMSAQSPVDAERKPVTWVKPYGAGRVVYTILGHGPATHADARYRQLVAQALEWAAGR